MSFMDFLKTEDKTTDGNKNKKQGVGEKVAKTAKSAIKTRKQRLADAAKEY